VRRAFHWGEAELETASLHEVPGQFTDVREYVGWKLSSQKAFHWGEAELELGEKI